MDYAIIELSNNQYKVEKGKELLIDRISQKNLEAKVLLLVAGDKVKIGKPYLNDVKVKIKVLEEKVMGEKISVFKYKAKSRYRKRIGIRLQKTRILIEDITLS